MNVSVIIPALNEAARIGAAVERAWAAGASEVLVVDGGSSDDTCQTAAAAKCTLIHGPAGRAAQQNAGAAQAEGDVLLFLHADNWLAGGAVNQIRHCLAANGDVQHGAFRQVVEATGICYRGLERGNAWRVRRRGLPYGDQGIFLRRECFFQAGGFPDVPLMEDLILMRTLRRSAWPRLLAGPLYVDPRRWQRHGIVRQTLRNWWLVRAYDRGTPLQRLAEYYRRHDR